MLALFYKMLYYVNMKTLNQRYVKTNLKSEITIDGIYTVHYFKYGKNFKFSSEKHDFWEMMFIDSGRANVFAEGKVFKLSQGQAFFHKPNWVHNISTEEEFANSVIIAFDCKSKALDSLSGRIFKFNDFEKSMLNKIVHETKSAYTDRLNDAYLKKMNRSKSAPFACEQIIKNCIELLLISLVRSLNEKDYGKEKIGLNSTADNIVENIINILKEMLSSAKNVSLDEISYRLNFSKSYIKSAFKKKTGYSIIQYYINMKIDSAKKLLSQQKYTVSEISDMLGFSSVYYFSRQFKEQTDMSPTEYINSIKAENIL